MHRQGMSIDSTGARYLIAAWAAHRLGSAFPYGTPIVNLTVRGETLIYLQVCCGAHVF